MIKEIIQIIKSWKSPNLRDRRAFYASQNQACLREQFWQWKGEPETNPIDEIGKTKMLIGDWIEKGLVKDVLSHMHFLGYHLIATQVPVGGSNPDWDGYLDALVQDKDGTKFVVEIKTKSGYGADLFLTEPMPSLEYIAQLGLYLKDVYEKAKIDQGKFIFVLLSDKTWGTIVIIDCKYVPETNSIKVERARFSNGTSKELNKEFSIDKFLERWRVLEKYLKEDKEPKAEYRYMYPITPETVREIPDEKLKKIIARQIVYGDWQLLYSRYKDKHIEIDKLSRERTEEEINLCKAEYKRRHPKSRL